MSRATPTHDGDRPRAIAALRRARGLLRAPGNRTRLTALVAGAVVVTFALVAVLVSFLAGRHLRSEAYDQLELAARAGRAMLQSEGERVRRQAERAALAVDDAVVAGSPGLSILVPLVRQDLDLDVLVVATPGGEVLTSSRREPGFPSGVRAPSDRELLARARRPGTLASTATAVGPAGVPAGSVVAASWVDGRLLSRMARAVGTGFTIADDGVLLATTLDISRLPELPRNARFTRSLAGDELQVVATGVSGTDGRLLATAPASEALAPRGRLVGWLVGGLVLVTAAAAAAVWLGSRRSAAGRQDAQLEGYVQALEESRAGLRLALAQLGEALAARDRTDIVDVILRSATLTAGAECAVLYSVSGPNGPLTVWASHGVGGDGYPLDPGEGVAGAAAATDTPARWPGGAAARSDREPPATTGIALPLHSGGRLIGVLAVYARDRSRRFAEDDLADLETLAVQAETAIDNVLLREEAERLSLTDGLTGVWNRRHFDLRAAEELARSRRFEEPFSLVLLDADDFKRVNDERGHPAGDAVLVELAGRLVAAVREVDVVARYGGEEFALLLPRTGLEGAMALAEKVRMLVATSAFAVDGEELHVTISAGLASHPDHGSTVAEMVAAADAALYQAKAAGKNRVMAAATTVAAEGSTG